jgi:hypothetical protein
MNFDDHACITSTPGKQLSNGTHVLKDEYAASKKKVEDLIDKYNDKPPWVPAKGFANDVAVRIHVILAQLFGLDAKTAVQDLGFALHKYGGLSKSEAKKRAGLVRSELPRH